MSSDESQGSWSGPKRWIVPAIILVGLVAGVNYLQSTRNKNIDFTLTNLDGETFSLSDFRGSVVVLDFMATWCGPCRFTMPVLTSIHQDLGDQFELISISVDPTHDTEEVLRAWADEYDADWIHARDLGEPPIFRQFQVTGVPTFFLIDKRGAVRFRHVGPVPEATLKQEILSLINE